MDLGKEVNVMTPVILTKLDFTTRKTYIEAQRIDSSLLETYNMVLANIIL